MRMKWMRSNVINTHLLLLQFTQLHESCASTVDYQCMHHARCHVLVDPISACSMLCCSCVFNVLVVSISQLKMSSRSFSIRFLLNPRSNPSRLALFMKRGSRFGSSYRKRLSNRSAKARRYLVLDPHQVGLGPLVAKEAYSDIYLQKFETVRVIWRTYGSCSRVLHFNMSIGYRFYQQLI